MTYTITTQPHPLDGIWSLAKDRWESADTAVSALGSSFEDHELDAAGALLTEAVQGICALPARNLSDTFFKLNITGVWDGQPRNDVDIPGILLEGMELLEAALTRGRRENARGVGQ